jgi:hypothetical protein
LTMRNRRRTARQEKHGLRELRRRKGSYMAVPLLIVAVLVLGGCSPRQPETSASVTPEEIVAEIIPHEGDPTSYGIPLALSNTQRFIDYYNGTMLTSEQEAISHKALLALRAPCCDDNSMDSC